MKTQPTPEKYIQQAICDLLDIIGVVYSVTDATMPFGPDGRPRKSRVKAGWPDITMILPEGGVAAFFEVKTRTGSLREAQKEMRVRLMEQGALVSAPRSLDDAIKALKQWLPAGSQPFKELKRMKL